MPTREWLERERRRWQGAKRTRPVEVVKPGPGQESVWDYPRPPRLEVVAKRVRVELGGLVLADTRRALRVCETASPPAYYIPPADVRLEHLRESAHQTFCEWKGLTRYWIVQVGEERRENAAWSYPEPDSPYGALRDHIAFHAGHMDACHVGEARVTPQPGDYYGGWVTPELVGPFKGEPGSEAW